MVDPSAAGQRRKYSCEALADPPVAVEEFLRCPKWGVMKFLGTLNEAESCAKRGLRTCGRKKIPLCLH